MKRSLPPVPAQKEQTLALQAKNRKERKAQTDRNIRKQDRITKFNRRRLDREREGLSREPTPVFTSEEEEEEDEDDDEAASSPVRGTPSVSRTAEGSGGRAEALPSEEGGRLPLPGVALVNPTGGEAVQPPPRREVGVSPSERPSVLARGLSSAEGPTPPPVTPPPRTGAAVTPPPRGQRPQLAVSR
jgi:hypothetical protein